MRRNVRGKMPGRSTHGGFWNEMEKIAVDTTMRYGN